MYFFFSGMIILITFVPVGYNKKQFDIFDAHPTQYNSTLLRLQYHRYRNNENGVFFITKGVLILGASKF